MLHIIQRLKELMYGVAKRINATAGYVEFLLPITQRWQRMQIDLECRIESLKALVQI